MASEQRSAPRIARACDRCRSRKVRCNGHAPCSACLPGGHSCIYRQSSRHRRRRHQQVPSPSSQLPLASPTPLPTLRPPHTLHDPAQFKRHKELRAGIGVSNVDTGSFHFYGPSSHFCFIQRMCQRMTRTTNETLLSPGASISETMRKWNLHHFMFSLDVDRTAAGNPDAYISQEMGTGLIKSYFEIIHPQIPVLDHDDLLEQWESLWKPPTQQNSAKSRDILCMVLAIGARVAIAEGQQDTSWLEGWASHFASKANGLHATFENISLSSTHFLLLRAMYAYQLMRPNEAYLYLGHAARSAMALGINRQQVVDGANVALHGLKRTFWTIYAHERTTALYTGRPSAFRDELNDATYPEDLPSPTSLDTVTDTNYRDPMRLCGFLRAMAGIGRIADLVFLEIYSPKSISNPSRLAVIPEIALQSESWLESVTRDLPPDLHFFDASLPIGCGWQEMQRLSLGCHYYLLRMLMHRPSLLFAAFFDSREEAQRRAGETWDLNLSIQATITAATDIIALTRDVYSRRYPRARFDGSSATILVAACVTLLYDVLDPNTRADHAKDVFAAVEGAIECLDQIHHVGPTNGKSVSLDVMRIAKDALRSTTVDPQLNQDLLGAFPWLHTVTPPEGPLSHESQNPFPSSVPNEISTVAADQPNHAASILAPEANYMSHWLEAGFTPGHIPSCLF